MKTIVTRYFRGIFPNRCQKGNCQSCVINVVFLSSHPQTIFSPDIWLSDWTISNGQLLSIRITEGERDIMSIQFSQSLYAANQDVVIRGRNLLIASLILQKVTFCGT